MKLFLGEYDHTLDERGRVTLPKKIRAEIDDRELVLAKGFDPCIFGFDKGSWEREAAKHLDTPVTDEKARNLRRYLFSAAQKVEIDKLVVFFACPAQGICFITNEVIVIGAGDHFEIWDRIRWEEYAKNF